VSKRLNVVSDSYFSKSHPDAFSNDQFDSFLRKRSVSEIILDGVFADQCVLSTARGAIHRGYSVVTVSDAVAAKNQHALQGAIRKHRSSGATIATTEDIVAALTQGQLKKQKLHRRCSKNKAPTTHRSIRQPADGLTRPSR
jgi:nicotinamidase-related amidase